MIPEDKRCQQSRLPRDERRIGRARALGERLGRQHDEEDVGEERDGVDAVGKGADVVAAGALREAARLDRVADVPHEDGNGGGRQHPAVNELGEKPSTPRHSVSMSRS